MMKPDASDAQPTAEASDLLMEGSPCEGRADCPNWARDRPKQKFARNRNKSTANNPFTKWENHFRDYSGYLDFE